MLKKSTVHKHWRARLHTWLRTNWNWRPAIETVVANVWIFSYQMVYVRNTNFCTWDNRAIKQFDIYYPRKWMRNKSVCASVISGIVKQHHTNRSGNRRHRSCLKKAHTHKNIWKKKENRWKELSKLVTFLYAKDHRWDVVNTDNRPTTTHLHRKCCIRYLLKHIHRRHKQLEK